MGFPRCLKSRQPSELDSNRDYRLTRREGWLRDPREGSGPLRIETRMKFRASASKSRALTKKAGKENNRYESSEQKAIEEAIIPLDVGSLAGKVRLVSRTTLLDCLLGS